MTAGRFSHGLACLLNSLHRFLAKSKEISLAFLDIIVAREALVTYKIINTYKSRDRFYIMKF